MNLTGQNLTNADLGAATLNNANFSQANLTNANLGRAMLTGANLSQANLTGADFSYATLTGANLTGADVRGTTFAKYSGGTGITPAQLYSTASYQAHDLTGIRVEWYIDLTGVNLAGQNLTNASFYYTSLSGANLTGAVVRAANLGYSGITASQLYSTASYQVHDLTGIGLVYNDLTGANLAGQNLANADFTYATLTGANLSQANLTNAKIYSLDLTGVNLTGAEVRGANFGFSGITAAQLYSTASYQAHDLTGIDLETGNDNLAGANLAGQNLANASVSGDLNGANLSHTNLTNANFFGYDEYTTSLAGANLSQADLTNAKFFYNVTLTGANLSRANLTNANFYGTSLTGANLTGADARGANFQDAVLTGANTSNLIQSDGHIAGLDLTSGASLVVRDYDGNPAVAPPTGPLPIVIDQHLTMNAGGTLRLVFDADAWDSTISFAPGISVSRGGTLELTFAPDVNLASQLGRTIDVFDWTGVTPTGAFTVSSPYTWNLTNLYTSGEVTLVAAPIIPGDFNNNGVVDAADYVVWRTTDGTPAGYNAWRTHFGESAGSSAALPSATPLSPAVPEPTALLLFSGGLAALVATRRARPTQKGGVRND